jgi:small multidrug resistance family-3 protein
MEIKVESSCVSKTRCILITIFLFILAGILEIGGGYLIWLWVRENKEITFAFLGAITLFLYGIVPTFQPSHFHRIYATYGGVFVVMSLLWGWIFDSTIPDIYDTIGALIILVGVAIIYYWPRGSDNE